MAPRVTAVVDTAPMLDFDTTISSVKNIARQGRASLKHDRVLMQGAAWMALACDLRRTVSVSLGHEVMAKLDAEAPPGTIEGSWTHLVWHVVRPHVCPRWRVRHTQEGKTVEVNGVTQPANNDQRDEFQYRRAKSEGIPFITSDERARKRALRAGVDAQTPAEFGESTMPFTEARDLFLARLRSGLITFKFHHGHEGHTLDNLRLTWQVYLWIWDLN